MTDPKKLNYLIVLPLFRSSQDDPYEFPLGIPYISGAMKAGGFNVFTLNLNHVTKPYEKLREVIQNEKIDAILTGGLSPQYSQLKVIFDNARDANKDIVTICGGGIISGDPESTMKAFENVDFGVIGEGEITVCDLCLALENNSELEDVDGIIYKKDDSYVTTNPRAEIEDLGTVAWPDYDGFAYSEYLDKGTYRGSFGLNCSRILSIVSSRSCTHNCTFCFHSSGKKYRQRPLDDVFNELDYLLKKYSIEFVYFMDELFGYDKKRVAEFCDRIKKYNIPWRTNFRVNIISDEFLQMLAAANCDMYCLIGVESADDTVLKSMRKGITVEMVDNALECCRRNDFIPTSALIFGDVAETEETAANSLKWWSEHKEFSIYLTFIYTFPGTALYKHAIEHGIIKDPVQFLKDGCPYVNVSQMSDMQMAKLSEKIIDCNTKQAANIYDYTLDKFHKGINKIDITWNCKNCGAANSSKNYNLFAVNYDFCSSCNLRHYIFPSKEIKGIIDDNLSMILSLSDKKVAMWGMTIYIRDYIGTSAVIKDNDRISLIDINKFTQYLKLNDKDISSPKILEQNDFDTVIVCVATSYGSIAGQVRDKYKHIKHVIPIPQLIDPDFKICD